MRYATLADAIEQAIAPALGEHGNDYDLEAIARETFTYKVDTDADGNELLNTAGFEQTVDDSEFWDIVETHDTSGSDEEDQQPSTTAWLALDAGFLIHGEGPEVNILDANDVGDITDEPLPSVSLPLSLNDARDDHDKAQDAAEARLSGLGWETVGEWDAVDTGYTVKVRRISTDD